MGRRRRAKPVRKNGTLNRGKRTVSQLQWQSDFFKLRTQLRPLDLTIRKITGDGNCLFRSVSDLLTGSEDAYQQFRALAIDCMETNRDDFEPFVEDDLSFDDYIAKLSKDRAWGGNMELQALSLALQVNFRIHRLHGASTDIVNFGLDQTTLHLSYHNGDHYNSIRFISDNTTEPAVLIPFRLSAETPPVASWQDCVEFIEQATEASDKEAVESFLRMKYTEPPSIETLTEHIEELKKELKPGRGAEVAEASWLKKAWTSIREELLIWGS